MNFKYRWTKFEDEYLRELSRTLPPVDCVEPFRRRSQVMGWPCRSDQAIKQRIQSFPDHAIKWNRWTDEEDEALTNIFRKYQAKEAVQKFKDYGKYRHWPRRTKVTILERVYRLHGTRNLNEENYSVTALARVLKISPYRVFSWVRRKQLTVKYLGKTTKVTQDDFVLFAARHPHLLADADYDALAYFLGEEKTARIKRYFTPKKEVLHIPTNKVFPSVSAAAKACHLTYGGVRWHLLKSNSKKFCWREVG